MTQHFPLMIHGATDSEESLAVVSPYSGEQLATVSQANEQHVEQAMATAYGLFRDRDQWLSLEQRFDILGATAALMTADADALAKGDRVELRGFGAFSVRHRKARKGRNPRTGEAVEVEAKSVPFFRPGKELRARVNDGIDPESR